jgi:hypothetical protein
MAESLLVPCSVVAKVVKNDTRVPKLTPTSPQERVDPFNRLAMLEAGIHIHWALPDALTSARLLTDDGQHGAVFPGVPDLWVVVRFNPPSPNTIRTWTAWVVDSCTQAVTPFSQWTPPAQRDPGMIHTAPGMLPSAKDLGFRGWGYFDDRAQPEFDLASIVYYPNCRGRFGFHDTLDGLPKTGNVSYTVFGWYSLQEHDPLFCAKDRSKLLFDWKLTDGTMRRIYQELATTLSVSPSAVASLAWTPPISVQAKPAVPMQKINQAATHTARRDKLQTVSQAFPKAPANAPGQSLVSIVAQATGPTEIRCHGSVMQVSLAGSADPPDLGKDTIVRLYPSIKRATAAVVAGTGAQEKDVDLLEMLLQDLDHQKGTSAGLIDLPGAAHALSFQGAPGKSQFYARLDILPPQHGEVAAFNLMTTQSTSGRPSSGHWPPMPQRTASMVTSFDAARLRSARLYQPSIPPKSQPTQAELDQEVDNWVTTARTALKAAKDAAKSPIDPQIVRVQDYRANAQPYRLGPTTDGSGPEGSGSWLDFSDPAAMKQMYLSARGARIYLPDASGLYEVPGPRWYRPWSPQVVLLGSGRSYRFGNDGFFEEDGFLRCRIGGHTLHTIATGAARVLGRDLLVGSVNFARRPGVPGELRTVIEEAALLDPDSSAPMFTDDVHGLWLSRDPKVSDQRNKLLSVAGGEHPSPVAITVWQNPWDPLFLDVNYTYAPSTIETSWTLDEEAVEFTPTGSPTTPVEVITERTRVTASIVKIAESALATKQTLDMSGNPIRAQSPPKNFDDLTFKNATILSAPLTSFDATLFSRNHRLRAGALSLTNLDLVDVFGITRSWAPGSDAAKATTPLTPRLPYWSRLQFRLQAASSQAQEASRSDSPICGWLVPNFVEHSLEVFDASGMALGRIRSDPPQFGNMTEQLVTLDVKFDPYPWVPANYPWNPTLKVFTDGVVAQKSEAIPPHQPPSKATYHETGLTALLRIIDTLRATVDPTPQNHDRKVQLLGRPIAIVVAHLWLETTAATVASDLKQDPPQLSAPPALPSIPVRVGAATRPDDGVLGCFLPPPQGSDWSKSQFAPVSSEAAGSAVFNGLLQGLTVPPDPHSGPNTKPDLPVTHPFIAPSRVFQVSPTQDQYVTILCDLKAGIYATCGVLPRKKILIPREFLDAGLRVLEPALQIGPFFLIQQGDTTIPVVPPPDITGYGAAVVRPDPAGPDPYPVTDVPPSMPVSDLPQKRASLSEGWYRLVKK